jgi:hypothetical protein
MKNFKDFVDSKVKKTIKQYNEDYGDCIEGNGYLYCYQEYYYILIDEYKKMGYESKQMYHLTLENDCDSSENLKQLELKLYHWFVSQNEDSWLYNVGIHNPKTTPLYFVAFQDMGFDVEDISYGNDECDCLRLYNRKSAIYDVYLPNSANKDWDNSKFNTFHILRLDENEDRIEKDLDNNLSLKELIDWIEEDLHQKARDIIDKMNESQSDMENGLDAKISLDDYITQYEHLFQSDEDAKLLNEARKICWYHIDFKGLDESTLFGSEPSQMFDDGLESKEEHNEYLFVLDFNIGEAFRYRITPQMRIDDCEGYEEFMDSQNHRVKDCQWMVSTNKILTKIENY